LTEPVQPAPQGVILSVVNAVKGMSLTNVLVIIMLAIVVVPSYLLWSVLNDPVMLGRFLSSYEEITSDKWPCTLRVASLRGAGDQYSISTGFAYQGSERWTLAVLIDRKPTDQEMYSYCETLNLLVDYMRNPDARSPNFPGTEEPLIHTYPRDPVAPEPP
jgi:hypothetical protein